MTVIRLHSANPASQQDCKPSCSNVGWKLFGLFGNLAAGTHLLVVAVSNQDKCPANQSIPRVVLSIEPYKFY